MSCPCEAAEAGASSHEISAHLGWHQNDSIRHALVDLLGKPIAESSALCIPTANYAQRGGADNAWRFISGREPETPMCELGWKSLGVLELTALLSLKLGTHPEMTLLANARNTGIGTVLRRFCHFLRLLPDGFWAQTVTISLIVSFANKVRNGAVRDFEEINAFCSWRAQWRPSCTSRTTTISLMIHRHNLQCMEEVYQMESAFPRDKCTGDHSSR